MTSEPSRLTRLRRSLDPVAVHRQVVDAGPTAAGRANASVAAPHAEMRCFPAPPAMPVPPAVPAVPTMTRAWFGYPHWAAPSWRPAMVAGPMMPAWPPRRRWRPDLGCGGGEGQAEECEQTDNCGRQRLHHDRRKATRLRSGDRRPHFHATEGILVGPIGSIPPSSTDQIANVGPHIQILFMSNSGMSAPEREPAPSSPSRTRYGVRHQSS